MKCESGDCQGEKAHLIEACQPTFVLTPGYKLWWLLRNNGVHAVIAAILRGIRRFIASHGGRAAMSSPVELAYGLPEVLDLKPGELVRVRSEAEIASTLDARGSNKGLYWMPLMREFCGQEFKVFKRVANIRLESTGEQARVKNTVLLDDCLCKGLYGCDKSCFLFWREVWLERADECNPGSR
jgi:hypothetical protein